MTQRAGLIEGAFMIAPLRPTDLPYLSGQKSADRSIGTCDRERDLGETVIGLAIPGKAV